MEKKIKVVKCPTCGSTEQAVCYKGGEHEDIMEGYVDLESEQSAGIPGIAVFSHTEVKDSGDLVAIRCFGCRTILAGPEVTDIDAWYLANAVDADPKACQGDCEGKCQQ